MDPLTLAAITGSIGAVSRAIGVVKQGLESASDISEIAGHIDKVINTHDAANRRLKEAKSKKAKPNNAWERLLRFKLGSSGDDDPTSLANIASAEIAQRQMQEQIRSLSIQLNKRFGPDCWETILESQKKAKALAAQERRAAAERRAEAALEKRSLMKSIAIETLKVIGVVAFIAGGIAIIMYVRSNR